LHRQRCYLRTMNEVILVDEKDAEIGVSEKLKAHQLGLLHRAFSIFIFNSNNELLIQQRAQGKYHSGGLWTNTCCSHPIPKMDLVKYAKQRLFEEMGMKVDDLQIKNHFIYRAEFPNGLIEHELDYILIGHSNEEPILNPEEAQNFEWISLDDLTAKIKMNPDQFTFWLKEIINRSLI
jgi:isopentenyl-diphosphate delta-isomerase